jgi:hypothetical protein
MGGLGGGVKMLARERYEKIVKHTQAKEKLAIKHVLYVTQISHEVTFGDCLDSKLQSQCESRAKYS